MTMSFLPILRILLTALFSDLPAPLLSFVSDLTSFF